MPRSRDYFTLVTSLPALPPTFEVARPPISRPRLDVRLRMLHADDHRVASRMEGFLRWARLPLHRKSRDILAAAEALLATSDNAVLAEIVAYRVAVRVLVAALRARRLGRPPPVLERGWREADWAYAVRHRGAQRDFGLGGRFPWLEAFLDRMEAGEPMEAERVLLGSTWRHHRALEPSRPFSFDAVLLYLCRWDICDRWSAYGADGASAVFEHLLQEVLGERSRLFR